MKRKIYQETRDYNERKLNLAVFHERSPEGARSTTFYFWGFVAFDDVPHYWAHVLAGQLDPYTRGDFVDEMWHCAQVQWDRAARKVS